MFFFLIIPRHNFITREFQKNFETCENLNWYKWYYGFGPDDFFLTSLLVLVEPFLVEVFKSRMGIWYYLYM